MRPIEKGQPPLDLATGQAIRFTDYRAARPYLIERLGEYCSYCEMQLNAALAVEHVQPKSKHPEMELAWGNFLLACPHCNPIKGDQDVQLSDYLWPDVDDTHLAFRYDRGGQVLAVDGLLKSQAERMIELVGLNRNPSVHESSDRRLSKRRVKYMQAVRYREQLKANNNEAFRQLLTDLAKESGFWSVWVEVFRGDSDMIQRFIRAFDGTCASCFESQTFSPKSRRGG